MEEQYERLPEVVVLNGTQINGLTAKLVERTDSKAIYYRWDNVYEVFRIKVVKGGEAFGKMYPNREAYPGNEDFGAWAWAYCDKKLAMEMYENLPE